MNKHNTNDDCGCKGKKPGFSIKGTQYFCIQNIGPGLLEIKPMNKADQKTLEIQMEKGDAVLDTVTFIAYAKPEKGFVQMVFILPMDEEYISWDVMIAYISDYMHVANGNRSEMGGIDKNSLN